MSKQISIKDFIAQVSRGNQRNSAVYFLGIGGIGMSALARYFNSKGLKVSGYDKTPTVLTTQLQSEGIAIHFEDRIDLIEKEATLVIYTPAIPKDHQEYNYFLKNNYTILKRSEVLGIITESSFNICVAGTHGKTTTSSMIAHILRHSEFGCNAFLGGIATNYDTNFWSSEKNICVVEADEYDRSFLKLMPNIAVITAIDPDHLDIYGTAENFREAFTAFAAKVKTGGLLISKYGLNKNNELSSVRNISYSVSNTAADAYAQQIVMKHGSYQFDININGEIIHGVELNMGGMHNVENIIAAAVAAKYAGVAPDKIREAIKSYKGVKRRFEYIIKDESMVMIDDYAHHPQELIALIGGAKELFPEKKCTVVFQPHLFSRTNDFADDFATALSRAEEVFILPIYPARELPMEGVTSSLIASKMNKSNVVVCTREELIRIMEEKRKSKSPDMLITAGAGDIDTLVNPLKQIFENKHKEN